MESAHQGQVIAQRQTLIHQKRWPG